MTTLADIANALGACLHGGNPETVIVGVAPLSCAHADQISFLTHPRCRNHLHTTCAAAVILAPEEAAMCPVPTLVTNNPRLAYARVANLFVPENRAEMGIHPSAVIHPSAIIANGASIGPLSAIEAGAVVSSGVVIGAHCFIGEQATIGENSHLTAHVTICHRVQIGKRALIHPGVVVGGDGFGFALDEQQRWVKIPQLGTVLIGDDVEIGANTTIDRGALEDTVIEDGVKLDNQIQIAHNVRVGAHSALAGCVGVAGSAQIGRYCMIGGGVGIAGHLEIADGVQITGMSLVTQSITKPGTYSSGLAIEQNRVWNKISARLRQLDLLFRRVAALEKVVR